MSPSIATKFKSKHSNQLKPSTQQRNYSKLRTATALLPLHATLDLKIPESLCSENLAKLFLGTELSIPHLNNFEDTKPIFD